MHLFIHSSINCHCHEVLKWCFIWQIKIKNMLNPYFIIFCFAYIAYLVMCVGKIFI